MTQEEITALAREYAEEIYKDIEDERIRKSIIEPLAKGTEDSFRFLLRRYCLVEKEAVRKWTGVKLRLPELRERVLVCEKHPANQYKIYIGKRVPSPCPDGWDWNQSTKENVVAWMPLPKYNPGLGKEVEG